LGAEDRITIDSEILGGKPTIKGTRIPVYLILELLASGMSVNIIIKEYPELTREDVHAALEYASKLLKRETIFLLEA